MEAVADVQSNSNSVVLEPIAHQSLHISNDERKWFAIYTRFKREKMVFKQLLDKNVEAYLPLRTVKRVYTRKIKKIELPLISCYVFVKIFHSEYFTVLSTQDVVNFVKFSHELLAIPEREINILKAITGENIEVEATELKPEVGDDIEICFGSLYGLKGKLVDHHNDKNVVIELEQMGFSMRMHVDPQYLKIINKSKPDEKPVKKEDRLLDRLF
ncbi:MAG: UpxY family transcription antiterminator [Bacteroidetes bacterium]|jgi:transcription antitermination factor NusG|nr:UpxY family transcription antiterminator [Bacteroidota bacterium]